MTFKFLPLELVQTIYSQGGADYNHLTNLEKAINT